MGGKIGRNGSSALVRQRLIALRGTGHIGVRENVDVGLALLFFTFARISSKGCVELPASRRASFVERQCGRDSNDDRVADPKHIEADPGGLRSKFSIELQPYIARAAAALRGRILAARIFAVRACRPPMTSPVKIGALSPSGVKAAVRNERRRCRWAFGTR